MIKMRFVAVILVALSVAGALVEASDVLELTPDNFEKEVGQDRAALVEFFAPWCGHCKKLAPEYEKLAHSFKKVKDVAIAKVDCDAHKDLCSKYGIGGYPTLKWFPKGSLTPKDYSGGRTAEELVKFVNEEAGAHARLSVSVSDVVVLTPANFDEVVLDNTKDVLVEFYAPWCGHCKHLAPVYEEVGKVFKADKNVVVAKLDADAHKDLASKYGVEGYPTLKFFSKANKDPEDCNSRSLEEFVDFLNEKCGTYRESTGKLADKAGRVASLDAIVGEFVGAKPEDKSTAAKKLEDEISKLEGVEAEFGKVYAKVLKSVVAKGDEYPQKEYERLSRLVSGTVIPSKADELTIKKNVLSSFLKERA